MEKRRYTYKGNTYEVMGECRMKDSEKNWIDAVRYRDINNSSKGEFVRSKEQFQDRFIPTELQVGDKVLVVSMGKKIGIAEVGRIIDDFALLKRNQLLMLPLKIPREINQYGGITTDDVYDYFFHNKTVEDRQVF